MPISEVPDPLEPAPLGEPYVPALGCDVPELSGMDPDEPVFPCMLEELESEFPISFDPEDPAALIPRVGTKTIVTIRNANRNHLMATSPCNVCPGDMNIFTKPDTWCCGRSRSCRSAAQNPDIPDRRHLYSQCLEIILDLFRPLCQTPSRRFCDS